MLPLLLPPPPPPPPPIIGGTADTAHPAVGALLRCSAPEDCTVLCSASLITPDHILTAAHCAEAAASLDVRFVLGADADAPDLSRTPSAWAVHPDYGLSGSIIVHDVAIGTLGEPIDDLTPLSLSGAAVNSTWRDAELTYVGYGATNDSGQGTGLRRAVEIPTADFDNQVILGVDPDGLRNVCDGDSGGAALRDGLVVGVTSFVFPVDGSLPCLGGGVGASRVDVAADFILALAPDADIQDLPDEEADADTDADTDTDTDTAGDTAAAGDKDGGGCRQGRSAGGLLVLSPLVLLRRRRSAQPKPLRRW